MTDPTLIHDRAPAGPEECAVAEPCEAAGPDREPAFPGASEAPRQPRAGSVFLAGAQSLCITIVIAIFVITLLVQAFQIPSESMENTLLVGDYLLVSKVDYAPRGRWPRLLPYDAVHRGDIIVFRYPLDPSQHFVKRVIGVPGDRIRLRNHRVYVNDRPLEEPYTLYKPSPPDYYRDNFPAEGFTDAEVNPNWWMEIRQLVDDNELVVPEGSYFVLGDNRNRSLDSRYWGFVPRENVVGKPLFIYFSMRHPDGSGFFHEADDPLARLAYLLHHPSDLVRWHRSFRIIR